MASTASPLRAQDAPLLVVPEAKGHRLVLVDPRAKSVLGQIDVPGWPHEVAFSADGTTAYVPSYSDAIVGMPGKRCERCKLQIASPRSFPCFT